MKPGWDALLLLGLELGEQDAPAAELRLRVQAAADAYRQLVQRGEEGVRIVACGGATAGHEAAEADVMADLLARLGVPRTAILLERRSQTTAENIRYAAALLGCARGKRVLVVTSDYHLRRAVLTARRAGFRAKGMPVPLPHDEVWRTLAAKERAYTLDLLMGWQDEGRRRPAWTYRLFDAVFGQRKPG